MKTQKNIRIGRVVLNKMGACHSGRESFGAVFPRPVEITHDTIQTAVRHNLNIFWFLWKTVGVGSAVRWESYSRKLRDQRWLNKLSVEDETEKKVQWLLRSLNRNKAKVQAALKNPKK